MSLSCTRCENSGFLNLHLVPEVILEEFDKSGEPDIVLDWMKHGGDNDVSVCDCCGNKDDWYGVRGEHYNSEDPQGRGGPYEYNGGLCECH